MNTVKIISATPRTTSKGDPYVNGDAEVDGVRMGYAVWSHPQQAQIQAGTVFQIELDGRNAKTQMRQGKTQLSINEHTPITFVGMPQTQPAPAQQQAPVQPAPQPAPVQPTPTMAQPAPATKTSVEIMERNAELNLAHYNKLVALGFTAEQAIEIVKHQPPGLIVPTCWFGKDPEKQL